MGRRWNGSGWTTQTTPVPAAAVLSSLDGVSCVSSSFCIAVGTMCTALSECEAQGVGDTQRPFAELWDGSRWSILDMPPLPSNTIILLRGLSCASAQSCLAIGNTLSLSSGATAPFAEWWGGSGWTVLDPPPNASSFGVTELNGVSCASPTSCVAVGASPVPEGDRSTVAEVWDGTAWTVQKTSTPTTEQEGPSGTLSAISCTSATACTAVGTANAMGVTLAEAWNGARWTIQATPPTPGGGLNDVSCSSATSCIAVGSGTRRRTGEQVRLTEAWNGANWTGLTLPVPAGAQQSQLDGVSCPTASACFAVGRAGSSLWLPLVERQTDSSPARRSDSGS